jgi:hypothetical protein
LTLIRVSVIQVQTLNLTSNLAGDSDAFGVKKLLGQDREPTKAVEGAYTGKPVGDGEPRGRGPLHKHTHTHGQPVTWSDGMGHIHGHKHKHTHHDRLGSPPLKHKYTWVDEQEFRHTYMEGRGPKDGHFIRDRDPTVGKHRWVDGQGFFAHEDRHGNGGGAGGDPGDGIIEGEATTPIVTQANDD